VTTKIAADPGQGELFESLALRRWALFAALAYAGLIASVLALLVPLGRSGQLPERYFELNAAARAPALYVGSIAFDVMVWIAQSGFLLVIAVQSARRAPLRSAFIHLLAAGLVAGFAGACLRIAGTVDLAQQYANAAAADRALLLRSYDDLLRTIDILFSAGGLLGGIALVTVATLAWSGAARRRIGPALGIAGALEIAKGGGELVTRADLGAVALLAGLLLIAAWFGIALGRRARVPAAEGGPS
jgi:hypothetical protein